MIGKLFSWVIGTFCAHRWIDKERQPVYQTRRNGTHGQLPLWIDYVLQCEKCGTITKKRV